MDQKRNKLFFYFNGDSFTEGAGISDIELFPEYPGHVTDNQQARATGWSKKKIDILFKKGSNFTNQVVEDSKSKAYPAVIGKLANAEIYNNGVGGSSIFGILVRTISDLTRLSAEGRVPDQVFIGLTGIDRVSIINENNKFIPREINQHWVQAVMPSFIDAVDSIYRNYALEYWKSHSDGAILTNYLYHCHSIKTVVKQITGKDPIFLRTFWFWEQNKRIVAEANLPMLSEIWEILDFDTLEDQTSFHNFAYGMPMTACGHFIEESHIKYGNYIFNKYVQKSS